MSKRGFPGGMGGFGGMNINQLMKEANDKELLFSFISNESFLEFTDKLIKRSDFNFNTKVISCKPT